MQIELYVQSEWHIEISLKDPIEFSMTEVPDEIPSSPISVDSLDPSEFQSFRVPVVTHTKVLRNTV